MGTLTNSLSGAELRRRLPREIWRRLWATFRRARRMSLLKGFFVVLTTALLCLLGLMVIDAAVTIFSQLARLAMSLGALAVVLGVTWWWMVRPSLRRMDLTGLARLVERRHPELQETVSSAVQFLASDEPDEIRGSKELIGEVVKSAVRDVSRISPRREFDSRPARPWGLSALAIVLLLVLLGVLWPKPTIRLLVRAVAPFHDIGNAYADTLQVAPGDAQIAAGADFAIDVSIRNSRLKRATVRRCEGEGQPEGVERMNLVGKGEDGLTRFSLVIPAVRKDFVYRVHAGNAVSRPFEVRVVEPPHVKQVTVRYEYPAYTGMLPREEVCQNGEITALEHTKLRVRASTSGQIQEAQLMLGGKSKPMAAKLVEGADPEWEWVLGTRVDRSWEMKLRDSRGFSSEPVTGQVRSIPDRVPEMKLLSPEARDLRLRPSEYLPLTYEAREDFGFTRAELIVRMDGRESPVLVPVDLPRKTAPGAWEGKAGLALSDLDLERVNRLSAQLRLVDTLPAEWGGGQEVLSDLLNIRLEKGAKPLAEQVLESQEQEIRRELEKARSELQAAKVRGDEALKVFSKQDTVNALSRLEDSRRSTAQAENRLNNLAMKMEKTAFAERAKEMRAIADGPVRQAREKAESAPLMDRASERDQQLQKMGEKLNDAMQQMANVLANLQKSKDEAKRVAELARLAQEQQRLAQQAKRDMMEAEMAKALAKQNGTQAVESPSVTAQALATWKRQQEMLQKELAEVLRKDPEALRQTMEAQAKEAKAMAREAEALKGEQKKLEELTGKAEQASEEKVAEELRRDLLKELKTEQESIEKDAQGLREKLRKQYPAAADAHAQLAEASTQGQRAAREIGRNELAPAREAADQAGKELQKVTGEAREELAKEAIRQRTEQMLEGSAAEQGNLSEPVESALDSLARAVAEKLVETPWPSGQPVSLEAKLGEALNAVKQAMAEVQNQPPAAADPQGNPQASKANALARAVTEKGNEMLKGWSTDQAAGEKPARSSATPLPADPEAVKDLDHLASRQESVAKVLDALARGQLGEALAAREEQMAAQTSELSGNAEVLKASTAGHQGQAKPQADQARAQLEMAERQALAAARDLARAQLSQDQKRASKAMSSSPGTMDSSEAMEKARRGEIPQEPPSEAEKSALRSSRQAQQRSGEALAQAAQRLGQAAESLSAGAKAAAGMKSPAQPGGMDSKDLAQSFSHVSQAAQADDAAAASSHASKAAEDLKKMARKMAEGMGTMENWADSMVPSDSSNQSPEASGNREKAAQAGGTGTFQMGKPDMQARGDGVPPEMAKWGVSAEDWASLKGALDANVAEGQKSGMPLEYRGLVGDYFRVLAEEARRKKE